MEEDSDSSDSENIEEEEEEDGEMDEDGNQLFFNILKNYEKEKWKPYFKNLSIKDNNDYGKKQSIVIGVNLKTRRGGTVLLEIKRKTEGISLIWAGKKKNLQEGKVPPSPRTAFDLSECLPIARFATNMVKFVQLLGIVAKNLVLCGGK